MRTFLWVFIFSSCNVMWFIDLIGWSKPLIDSWWMVNPVICQVFLKVSALFHFPRATSQRVLCNKLPSYEETQIMSVYCCQYTIYYYYYYCCYYCYYYYYYYYYYICVLMSWIILNVLPKLKPKWAHLPLSTCCAEPVGVHSCLYIDLICGMSSLCFFNTFNHIQSARQAVGVETEL